MEGGSLFNSGFLGASFNWWIGQIASDSTWRDNMLPGKFESKDQIPGWGRRYKVRIIGLHDREEESISSDQLPWAQVMYPVTAGGGQAGSLQTPNLRQGNFVFGFFLDGQDQQVPVIMGVLGSNAQTTLATQTGNNQSNFASTSGFADPADGNKDPYIRVPDESLVINKPKSPDQSKECSPPPKGVAVNKFGLRTDQALTKTQFQDQQSAIAEAQVKGLTGTARDEFIQQTVSQGIKNRCEQANSPSSSSNPGATRENSDAVHEQSNADTKRHDLYLKKTAMLSPCDLPGSSLKAMQIELDGLTKEIDKILQAGQSYIDAVSQVSSSIPKLIDEYSGKISKYMKIVFDKIFEYGLKEINKAIAPTVDKLFPNLRHQYLEVKEKITELIRCVYSKINNNLFDQTKNLLTGILDTRNSSGNNSSPYVPICSVETLSGSLIASNINDINNAVDGVLTTVNSFLGDILGDISSIIGQGFSSLVDGINTSIASAFLFENIIFNLFNCDLKPNCAASDYYSLQNGSGSVEGSQQPRPAEIGKNSQNQSPSTSSESSSFIPPSIEKPDYDWRTSDRRSPEQIASETSIIA
jgi:hypothetical protein